VIASVLYGLRGRLVLALLLTCALSLGVVAVTLLPRLESLLRRDRLDTLTAAAVAETPRFDELSDAELRRRGPSLVRALGRSNGAAVTLLDARGRVVATSDPDEPVDLAPVARALDEHHVVRRVVDTPDGPEARVAVPLAARPELGLLLRAPLKETQTAADVVRRALLGAVLVALAVALVVGLALAGRLARRLRRLRDTALRVAEIGPTVEIQADGRRDEVGDLTRAIATMQNRLREQENARPHSCPRPRTSCGPHSPRCSSGWACSERTWAEAIPTSMPQRGRWSTRMRRRSGCRGLPPTCST
jgi:HAMP domain-containing protein